MLIPLFFVPLVVATLFSFFSTPLTILLSKRLGLTDNPKTHKHPKVVHAYTVPRGGGLPIFFALLSSLLFLPLNKPLIGILVGATIALTVGLLDDYYEEKISPLIRLASNFLVAGCVVMAGVQINFITNPVQGGIVKLDQIQIFLPLSSIIALFWIAWCMNFVGFSGGVDGQLPGFVAISATTIGILSLNFTEDVAQWPVIALAGITAGAYLGFLPWNFYPQKIIPGYGGKSLAGFLLATLSILSGAKLATAILVLGIPLTDALFVVFNRIRKGRLPFWGDRGHLHHRLLDLGWGKRRIALFYWCSSAILGIMALNLNSKQKFYTIILLPILFLVLILWINYLSTSLRPPGRGNG